MFGKSVKVKAKKYNVSKKKYDDIMDSLDADMKIKVLRQNQFEKKYKAIQNKNKKFTG
tara:strand:+ start:197 stop:370 length:174 start_codon:yes stop_codon:yes gene_type:complete